MTRRSAAATARLARCTVNRVSVELPDGGRVFAAGDTVDLDAEAALGLTWREALGDHVAAFVVDDKTHGETPQE